MPIVIVHKALPSDDPIIRAAERMEGALRAAFLRAVARVRDEVALRKLADAIAAGDVDGALAILAIDRRFVSALQGVGIEPGIESFRDAVQATVRAGAAAAMRTLPRFVGVNLSFDLLNPEAVNHIRSYTFDLIQQVTQETRDAVQRVVLRAFREGGHPYEQARTIRRFIGLTARQEQAIATYRASLEGGGPALRDALSRALRDGRYDATLLRAMRDGAALPGEYVDKLVARYRDRYVQYRARNIARTETLRASNIGKRLLWQQAVRQDLLPAEARRRWIVSGDERTCPECMALDGRTAGLDEPFAPGIVDPPDPHPSCRCTTSIDPKSLRRAA